MLEPRPFVFSLTKMKKQKSFLASDDRFFHGNQFFFMQSQVLSLLATNILTIFTSKLKENTVVKVRKLILKNEATVFVRKFSSRERHLNRHLYGQLDHLEIFFFNLSFRNTPWTFPEFPDESIVLHQLVREPINHILQNGVSLMLQKANTAKSFFLACWLLLKKGVVDDSAHGWLQRSCQMILHVNYEC